MRFANLLCLSLLAGPLFGQLPIDSLVAHYNFNGALLDISGEDNHIVDGSGSFTTDRFGNANSAWQLDGVNDSLTFPIAELSPIQGDFTIALWYRTNSPQVMSLFSSHGYPNDTTANFEIELNSNSAPQLEVVPSVWYQTYMHWDGAGNAGNAHGEGTPGPYTKGTWTMFVVQREADTLRVFRNHVLHTPSVETPFGGILGDTLDAVLSAFPHRFKGAVDDLRFYDRALAQAEIDQLWFEGRAFVFMEPKPTDAFVQGMNVLAWWQYDTTQVSDSINVEFRIDGGAWQPAAHSHMAYEYYTYVDMGLPFGTGVEVRVTDVTDPSLTASSGTFEVSEYHWEEVSDSLPFTARDGSGLLDLDNKMWLLGGWDPPYHPPLYTHNEIWSSSDGATWSYEGDAAWSGRHISGWMVYDDAMWLVGSDPQAGCLSDVWRSANGVDWELILDTIPGYARRYDACYAALDDRILMFGGEQCGITWPGEGLSDAWSSADGVTWSQLPDAPWHGRGMQLNSCVDDDGFAWFLGGSNDADRRSYNEVWKTSDGTDWTLVNEAAPWTGRYWHTVAWFDEKIWLLAGMATGTEMNDVWYSSDGITWNELKSPAGSSPSGTRHAHSTTVFGDALWYMCGISTNSSWKITRSIATGSEEVRDARPGLTVYPNPSNGDLTILCDRSLIGEHYTLYNSTGASIRTGLLTSERVEVALNGSSRGLYVLSIDGHPSSIRVLVL